MNSYSNHWPSSYTSYHSYEELNVGSQKFEEISLQEELESVEPKELAELKQEEKQPLIKKGRALKFLRELSTRLFHTTHPIKHLKEIEEKNNTVSIIQGRVEKRSFYKLMSWVPQTNAYTVAQMLTLVRAELSRKKEEIEAEACKNTTDPYQFFKVSENFLFYAVDIRERSWNNRIFPSNQLRLFYVNQGHQAQIGRTSQSFQSGEDCKPVSFLIEWDPSKKFVKILVDSKKSEGKNDEINQEIMEGIRQVNEIL